MSAPAVTSAPLEGCKLLLGVTGGIAAYKAAELVRQFKKAGADVQVLMTPDASRFITPLTLGALSEREVLVEIFPENETGSWTKHVTLGGWADLFVIAPATAQTLAKLAGGFSDAMLTATALAARCPILVFPAMDHDMYLHAATQANLATLRAYGYLVFEPDYGPLASGLVGYGRLPDPLVILGYVTEKLRERTEKSHPADVLHGQHVLVTAGPTREALDPVRFLSNHATGTMGYALAEAAAARGARVTLVSGPTALATPAGVKRIDVTTAAEMQEAVQAHREADLIIMAAAVADYAPVERSSKKIKKSSSDMTLLLRRTPDVLATLGENRRPGQTLVGFALETDHALENARRKLSAKNLDWIVLNDLSEEGAGFGTGTNRVHLISRKGQEVTLPVLPKRAVAEAILDHVTAASTPPEEVKFT